MRVFSVIFLSYLWQASWARLWPTRYDTAERWEAVNRRNAKRMYKGFVKLRGVYIKLGQILSIMGTFLPKAYTEELEGLQDEVPHRPYHEVEGAFVKAFGKKPLEAFATFGKSPIAAASLGQVHEATDREGRRLAVKVLYPNVAMIIKIDLKVLGWALEVYSSFVQLQQIERVHEQLTDMLGRETNLAHEAKCIARMSANFADDPDVLFPEVVPEWTCPTILTMSFMEGVKISKKDALATLQLDTTAVATKMTQVFYKQVFADRFFHADPHPGNFFVQRGPDGQVRIVILDLGSASEIHEELADGMLDILQGIMTRSDSLIVRGIDKMGFVAENGDRALLERTVKTYFEKLLNLNITDFGNIRSQAQGKLGGFEMRRDELRELMKSIQYPVGWFYIERAVIIMFGLCSQLAPKLNMLQAGLPYIMKFIAEQRMKRAAEAALAEAKANAEDSSAATAAP